MNFPIFFLIITVKSVVEAPIISYLDSWNRFLTWLPTLTFLFLQPLRTFYKHILSFRGLPLHLEYNANPCRGLSDLPPAFLAGAGLL